MGNMFQIILSKQGLLHNVKLNDNVLWEEL